MSGKGTRSLRFESQTGSLRIHTADAPPEPGPGEALIRPHRVAITATELAIVGGRLAPRFSGVLGHEFVGTVERVNLPDDPPPLLRDKHMLKGRRVVASPIIACGACDMCRGGLAAHCRSRVVVGLGGGPGGRDGVCAERITLPLTALQAVPDAVADDQAVLAYSVVRAAHAAQVTRAAGRGFVTVITETGGRGQPGGGAADAALALLIARVLSLSNRSTRVLSSSPAALGVCERWGLKHRPVEDAGRRQDQDVVVVCAPPRDAGAGVRTATQMVRPRGTVVLVSPTLLEPLPPGKPFPEPEDGEGQVRAPDLTPLMVGEIQLVGCRDGPVAASALSEALGLLQPGGGVDVASLMPKRVRLEDAPAAIQSSLEGDALGLVVDLGS